MQPSVLALGVASLKRILRCADESARGLCVGESRSKVLLVEDSKFLRIANERTLAKAGYEVCTAADGEEALRVATDELPDIILLDMLLPKLSGPEVLKALKSNPATMAIPVIVLSSLSQKNERKLKQEGAIEYLEKASLDLEKYPDRLADAVESVLRQLREQERPHPQVPGLWSQEKRP